MVRINSKGDLVWDEDRNRIVRIFLAIYSFFYLYVMTLFQFSNLPTVSKKNSGGRPLDPPPGGKPPFKRAGFKKFQNEEDSMTNKSSGGCMPSGG
ncbi:hypothetical protein HZS_6745 [Henneguya salminicola]|nr:hypothetical protein HZS_6745 [Henneguya salminicola]